MSIDFFPKSPMVIAFFVILETDPLNIVLDSFDLFWFTNNLFLWKKTAKRQCQGRAWGDIP